MANYLFCPLSGRVGPVLYRALNPLMGNDWKLTNSVIFCMRMGWSKGMAGVGLIPKEGRKEGSKRERKVKDLTQNSGRP